MQSILEKAKIEKRTAVEQKQLETARLVVVPGAQDKKYIPRLPPLITDLQTFFK